jgi:hypothetical protein
MHKVIDTPWNVTAHLRRLRTAGVETIIRYYNHQNSSKLPDKRIDKPEAIAIADEGLRLCVVFWPAPSSWSGRFISPAVST